MRVYGSEKKRVVLVEHIKPYDVAWAKKKQDTTIQNMKHDRFFFKLSAFQRMSHKRILILLLNFQVNMVFFCGRHFSRAIQLKQASWKHNHSCTRISIRWVFVLVFNFLLIDFSYRIMRRTFTTTTANVRSICVRVCSLACWRRRYTQWDNINNFYIEQPHPNNPK